VFYNNGFRVRGILAMSRAIGINVWMFTSIILLRALASGNSFSIYDLYPSSSIVTRSVYGKCICGFSVSWNQHLLI
jgi:hypothetical protein